MAAEIGVVCEICDAKCVVAPCPGAECFVRYQKGHQHITCRSHPEIAHVIAFDGRGFVFTRDTQTTAKEHSLARVSAYHTVRWLGVATVHDVVHHMGLCEIRAKRALEELVFDGTLKKDGAKYRIQKPWP